MVKNIDHLFAAPNLVTQKLGSSFEFGAGALGRIAQIETSLAQRVINQSRVSALFERIGRGFGAKQIARISITPLRDHEPERSLVIEKHARVMRLRILQMPDGFRRRAPAPV